LPLKPPPKDLEIESVNCLICGSASKQQVAQAKDYDAGYDIDWQVVKCLNCGFVFTDPRPTMACMLKYFYPDDYVCYQMDDLRALSRVSTQMQWDKGMAMLLEETQRLLDNPKRGRILDVGCAHGQILEYFRKRTDWELVGVEPVADVAEQAKQTGAEIHVATLEEANLPTGSFDVVLMSHVLEHVENPDLTVREVYRILKPEGYLLAFMPDHDGEDRKLFGNLWWGYHLPRHLYHFDFISISQLLEQRGFEIRFVQNARWPNLQGWNIEYQLRGRNAPDSLVKVFNRYNPALFPLSRAMGAYFSQVGGKHSGVMQVVARKSALWDSIPDEIKEKRRRNEKAMQKRQAIETLREQKESKKRLSDIPYLFRMSSRFSKPLITRHLEFAAKNLLTAQPTFWGADLAITYNCNYTCDHCFARSSLMNPSRQEMTTEQWIKVIKHLLDEGCIYFQMQGGEPLIHSDLYELIAACEPERSVVNVITNASLIGETELLRFKELGVLKLEVSIDSMLTDENEAFQGHSEKNQTEAFEHSMWVVNRAREIGIEGGIYTTITTDSLWTQGVQELIAYCRENRISQYFSIAIPAGAWAGKHEILINAVDREYLKLLCIKYPNAFRDTTHRRFLSYGPFRRRFFSYGCPAVKETLYFTPYGDVCPCPYTHVSLGNILEEPLSQIRNRAMKVQRYRDRVETCPAGEDHAFIHKYFAKTYGAELPLDGKELFEL